MKKNKGITLIALIITIIIILILAGVSLTITLDKNGIIGKFQEAKIIQKEVMDIETIQAVALGYLTETGKIDFQAFENAYTQKTVAGFEIKYIDDYIYATAEKDGAIVYYIDKNGNVTKTLFFNMIGTWNINFPSDGSTYTGIITVTGQTGTNFTGTIKIGTEDTNNITNGQISGTTVTFTRIFQQNYRQDYSGTLDVSNGTATIIGSFSGSGPMTFKMTKST